MGAVAEMEGLEQLNNNSLLLQLIKDVSALSAKFDSFEKSRCEDNMELKESIKKVDDKVDKLDAKFENMCKAHDKEITDVKLQISNAQKAPLQDKAAKWETATKIIIEVLLTACLGVLLVKIGIN